MPLLDCIELESAPQPTASILILHGLGADGNDFVPVCHELDLGTIGPVRFVLPNAPVRPVSINGGYEMRAWYDIIPTPTGRVEDEPSLRAAHHQIGELIDREVARGIAPERIVVMGFSQGCAMALMAGLRYPKRLAGIVALSGYLPLPASTASERSPANTHTPIFMAHGLHDDVVLPQRGEVARDHLESLGYSVQWHSYPMAHSLCLPEIQDLNAWLLRTLA